MDLVIFILLWIYCLASLHFGKDIIFKFNHIPFKYLLITNEFSFVIITYLYIKYFVYM